MPSHHAAGEAPGLLIGGGDGLLPLFRDEAPEAAPAEAALKEMKKRIIGSAICLVVLMYFTMGHMIGLPAPHWYHGVKNALVAALLQFFLTLPVVYLNRVYYSRGLKALWHRAPNMDSLIAVGSLAALGYGVAALFRMAYGMGHGDWELVQSYSENLYFESAAMILTLITVGKMLEARSKGKTTDALKGLMKLAPKTAIVERNGQEVTVPIAQVKKGDIFLVRPGENVPVDGVILEGSSTLNTSALTGESVPRDASEGDEVISGCINMTGVLRIKTTKEFGESTVSKILDMVENASSRKSRSENFISKFAKYYTPAVCYGALALAVLPPIVRMLFMGFSPEWGDWIMRALTFLVISCPCALVISIPLSFFAGIGGASNAGVLVKGSNYLETLAGTKYVVFDKTGTMTQGVFEVTGVHHNTLPMNEILEYAALAESFSSHPISRSLQKAYGKAIDQSRVTDVQEVSGKGVIAKVDGRTVAAGNAKLMELEGIPYQECHSVGTVVHMAVDGEYVGHILIADLLKPHAEEAIRALKVAGIKKTVMLTGDAKRVADKVAANLGIDEVHSELLPGDKVAMVEKLLSQKNEKEKLAFVGDGINDAPVLSRADIGIAMGAMGSDAAIEAADIVLMDDDPLKIAKAIRIARKCMRIVYENIYFAIGVKVICLILGALGIANMWVAIFADVGVMVIAVLNAIRTLYVKNL